MISQSHATCGGSRSEISTFLPNTCLRSTHSSVGSCSRRAIKRSPLCLERDDRLRRIRKGLIKLSRRPPPLTELSFPFHKRRFLVHLRHVKGGHQKPHCRSIVLDETGEAVVVKVRVCGPSSMACVMRRETPRRRMEGCTMSALSATALTVLSSYTKRRGKQPKKPRMSPSESVYTIDGEASKSRQGSEKYNFSRYAHSPCVGCSSLPR